MTNQGKFSTKRPSRMCERPLFPESQRLFELSPAMEYTSSLGTPDTPTNLPPLKYESACPENVAQTRPRLSSNRDCTKSAGSPLALRKIVVCPFLHLVKPS